MPASCGTAAPAGVPLAPCLAGVPLAPCLSQHHPRRVPQGNLGVGVRAGLEFCQLRLCWERNPLRRGGVTDTLPWWLGTAGPRAPISLFFPLNQRDCEHPRAKRRPERRCGRPEAPKLETLASLPCSTPKDGERRCEDAGWMDTVPPRCPLGPQWGTRPCGAGGSRDAPALGRGTDGCPGAKGSVVPQQPCSVLALLPALPWCPRPLHPPDRFQAPQKRAPQPPDPQATSSRESSLKSSLFLMHNSLDMPPLSLAQSPLQLLLHPQSPSSSSSFLLLPAPSPARTYLPSPWRR